MKKILILSLFFIISFATRLYQAGHLPAILNRDEAALAYNAYLLAETGQDEWGRSWPLSFESFGDYKLPGYIYALVALFKVFPTQDWVVKLPSILAGSSLVVLAFFFAKSIKFRDPWAWLLTVLVATTPVFFFYSRIAFEANLALAIFVAALTLLFTQTQSQQRLKFDFLATILIILAIFTYNTPLLLLPFILPIIVWLRGLKSWRKWLPSVLTLSVVMIVAGYQLLSLSSQKSGITIFQDETTQTNLVNYHQQFSGVLQTVLGNKYIYYSHLIGQNYLKSLSPNFLVNAKNTHPWHSLANHGHVLGVVYLFGAVGIATITIELISAVKKRRSTYRVKIHSSLLYLLLVSLLPAVITVDAPHATRSLLFFFLFNIFTLFGLKKSYHLIRDHTQIKKNALFISFSILLIISSWDYLKDYFTQSLLQQTALRPGFEKIIWQTQQEHPRQEIVVIDEEGYQYILLAWYLKITPVQFFESTIRQLPDKIGFSYGEQVANYHFIAHLDDRSETEKIAIGWNKVIKKWEVLEF